MKNVSKLTKLALVAALSLPVCGQMQAGWMWGSFSSGVSSLVADKTRGTATGLVVGAFGSWVYHGRDAQAKQVIVGAVIGGVLGYCLGKTNGLKEHVTKECDRVEKNVNKNTDDKVKDVENKVDDVHNDVKNNGILLRNISTYIGCPVQNDKDKNKEGDQQAPEKKIEKGGFFNKLSNWFFENKQKENPVGKKVSDQDESNFGLLF